MSFVFDDFVVAFLDLFVAPLVFVVSHIKKGTKPLLHVSRRIKQQPIFIYHVLVTSLVRQVR